MENLYSIRVEENVMQRRQLLQVIGSRETVIEASLRVMLDCAPAWGEQGSVPQFSIYLFKIKP